ncbi:MAG TPA: ABC transporter ATP-binding protein/permease [Candidatus Eisenbergiella merdipullorum]|uniref:ABC transporter ATP-binding protein/permease n=1 Tax=Candidatus Eisenbergiella merdipullorum TaxID=2838553 RepID=A0A9D2L1T1_9FIRM|nr:ABC transporter ATP-binding protein/permease [Candidatus Eisenbergiella merdipullorum]
MGKLFQHLWEHKLSVLLIILLLIGQAFCDLSLPSYTSDIVDVGIQQSGIENAVPERMREETFNNISLFLTEEERDLAEESYTLADGIRELNTRDHKTIGQLDEAFGLPMVILSSLQESGMDLSGLQQMMLERGMTEESVEKIRQQALDSMGDMSDSIISQRAVLFVQEEYKALGMDLGQVQMDYLLTTGAKMLSLTLLMVCTAVLSGLLSSRTAAKIGMDLRGKVFTKVLSFSNNELNKFSIASLITRSTNDIQQVQMVEVMLLRMVLYAPIIGIGGIIRVMGTKTGLGWIIVVAVVSIFALVGVLVGVAMPKFKLMQTLVDRVNLVAREILTGLSVIRAFDREKYEEDRFDKANRNLMKTQLFTNRIMTIMMPAMMLIMNAVTVMIIWFGGHGIDAGTMQVGDMIAFITYTMQIVMAFLMITLISVMLPRAGVAADRIQEVLDTSLSIHDASSVRDNELADARGELRFEDVSFRYEGADEDALEHISFTAKPGETTAIIGSTGCGKSTLIHLIPRFYDVTEGRITIDGIDIREISQKKLHSLLGFVPQKGNLFSGTIASNIKYGGDWITDEKMVEAAQIAQATEFIDAKPESYDSPIAQGGSNVSGGQKQRLSIARAIAKSPKIFLFDDSFSALDYKTDAQLRKALHEKTADATVLIVAQRISTILHANRIIVLEDGRIVGDGTHEELLETCEAYQEIARSQLSEAELKGGRAS